MADYFVHRSQSTANSARHIIVAGHRGQAPVRSVIGEAATHPPTPTPRDPAVLGMHRYSSFQLVEIADGEDGRSMQKLYRCYGAY